VYWNTSGFSTWSANGWSDAPAGSPNTNYFPLPQDIATFTDAGAVPATLSLDTAITYVPNVEMSGRTTAMTLGISTATTVYGNWTNGSGTGFTGSSTLTFSGGNTQTITSAGKTFSCPITVDTYGGTVQLADPLNIGFVNTLTVTNGTFTTNGQGITAGAISSSNSNVRTINLGASTVNLFLINPFTFTTTTNLTFNAGTSQITVSYTASGITTFNLGGLTYNNVTVTNASSDAFAVTFAGQNTFNNLTLAGSNASANIQVYAFSLPQTITGTLTCAGLSAVQRIFLQSGTLGTQRTLTAAAISADNCDFRDINLAGTASGATPTRAGDCGGNSGINFSTKTVYWNLGGAVQRSWASVTAPGWAPSSGGTPAINNFPLAQDTAVFDNAGAMPSGQNISVSPAFNLGTLDASNRTSTGILQFSSGPVVYKDVKLGTGISISVTGGGGGITFSGDATQIITSNGVQFGCDVTVNHPRANVQLADNLSLHPLCTLIITTGTFDAVTYNVTAGLFTLSGTATRTIRMGSGTWTASGTGSVWNVANNTGLTLVAGTSNIVLSNTSASARTFDGGTAYYNKLTIGGTTGTSTLTIIGSNTFGELASTKTVAHTIAIGTGVQTFGKWSVTGTAGNVVTVTGTSTTNVIAGPRVSGVDYLAMGTLGFSTTSPGEFYAGANSTGTGAGVILTAAPTPRTLYWRGGTGNWSDTTKWDTVSGGPGPAAIPTSADSVNFDSLSNATAYTITISGVTIARCAAFDMAGPALGNVTFAGSVPIAFHGNVLFAATGITRTYTGTMNWAGDSSYTFTTNGLVLASACTVIGIGSTWALGFNTSIGSTLTITYGAFSTSGSNYSLTASAILSNNSNVRTVSLNNSSISLIASSPVTFTTSTNLTFNAGTSTITMDASAPTFSGGGQTFYNVTFNNPSGINASITGANTFNNLTFSGRTTVGINASTFAANQTISGTLTVSAGTASAFRNFLASDTLGTSRTLNCAAVSLTDVDFRDITIAGAAAPASGTRLGDCKGNTGITFDAGINKYWTLQAGGNWSATAWTSVYSPLSPFGSTYPGSMQFNGTNQSVSTANNAEFNFGSGNFTVELWVYLTSTSTDQIPISKIQGSYPGGFSWALFSNAGGTLGFYIYTTTLNIIHVNVSGTLIANTWYHIAGVRNGSTLTLYLNGVSIGTTSASGSVQSTSSPVWIGRCDETGLPRYLNGYVSNARIVKGTAVYTSNFTPSTTPLTAISGTSLLVRGTNPLEDSSTNNFALTVIGGAAINSFPLAQDTALFQADTATLANASTVTVNANYNIGTIDMSQRTATGPTATMTLATSTTTPAIYGSWINGTGTTLSGSGQMTFAGRTTQQITSAGRTFTQGITVTTPGGSVTLQDDFITSSVTQSGLGAGTFNANGYNFTAIGFSSNNTGVRTIAVGSGTWVLNGTSTAWNTPTITNLTVTGTGTISLTNASSKTFSGGGISYSGITLNQGGAGALTITGNNTFKTITNTYSATGATSIALGNTTQTLTNPWTATGAATRILTISGTSAASPGTLVYSGAGTAANVDYLTINNVRAYPLATSWYAGTNSTNGGSLGWYFVFPPTPGVNTPNFFLLF
jgi:hypothetical protein